MGTMNIRHVNRGDIREGGCAMCKPVHKRSGSWTLPKDYQGVREDVLEYVDELQEEADTDYCDYGYE